MAQKQSLAYRIFRDSFVGNVIYRLSGRKILTYEEESSSYVPPEKYQKSFGVSNAKHSSDSTFTDKDALEPIEEKQLEQIIVTWDDEDDPENPYNWPMWYKCVYVFMIGILTAFIYMASAIYTPGIDLIMEEMGVSRVKATLPLTMFVIGYGLGPLVLSPLSENPRFGRVPIYILTLFIFVLLQIPTALVTDIASLTVLRLLAGFFASPCLATGGASIGDITPVAWMPMSLAGWSAGAICAPTIGPLIGAALVVSGGYHWPFWFILIASGTLLLFLSFTLPESYNKSLLYRKAERLRRVTGNENITSEGHLQLASKSSHQVLVETLWRPFEIMLFEPVVMLINVYLGLTYAIVYLWFEAFPIIFYDMYDFTLVTMGAAYLSLVVGVMVGLSIYLPVVYHIFTKKLEAGKTLYPEVHLPMCIFGSVLQPVGLIIVAWTSTRSVHWIGPMIGAGTFFLGAFIVFQTLFNYLGMSFYRYLASVYASNAFFRACMGGAFPLFGSALYDNLATKKYPVAWGTMILAFIMITMVLIPVFFLINGPKLRARSKYAN